MQDPPPQPAKPQLVVTAQQYEVDVNRIMQVILNLAKGEKTELGACFLEYGAAGGYPCSPSDFMDAVIGFCKRAKIKTREVDGRPYLLDVQLVASKGSEKARA